MSGLLSMQNSSSSLKADGSSNAWAETMVTAQALERQNRPVPQAGQNWRVAQSDEA